MNKSADNYFLDGCGRCPLGGTENCKVNFWREELILLREIVSESELIEECKWGVPCYTFEGKNVISISAFKESCVLSFFKGSLLKDKEKLLVKTGERSQAANLFRFTDIKKIKAQKKQIKEYILEAIEIEKSGKKVVFNKNPEPAPEELTKIFKEDHILEAAFNALTPGRQRGYLIHFAQAKQSATRISRIKKCSEKIMNGKGMHDR